MNELRQAQKSMEGSQALRFGTRTGLLRETESQQGFGELKMKELDWISKGVSHLIKAATALDTSRIMNGNMMLNKVAKSYIDEYPDMLLLIIKSYEDYCRNHDMDAATAVRYMSKMAEERHVPPGSSEGISEESFKKMESELDRMVRNSVRRIVRK